MAPNLRIDIVDGRPRTADAQRRDWLDHSGRENEFWRWKARPVHWRGEVKISLAEMHLARWAGNSSKKWPWAGLSDESGGENAGRKPVCFHVATNGEQCELRGLIRLDSECKAVQDPAAHPGNGESPATVATLTVIAELA
jgi:hypothetical protein